MFARYVVVLLTAPALTVLPALLVASGGADVAYTAGLCYDAYHRRAVYSFARHLRVLWRVPVLPVFPALLVVFLARPNAYGAAVSASTPLVCISYDYDS